MQPWAFLCEISRLAYKTFQCHAKYFKSCKGIATHEGNLWGMHITDPSEENNNFVLK
jgi:hypothetical protein